MITYELTDGRILRSSSGPNDKDFFQLLQSWWSGDVPGSWPISPGIEPHPEEELYPHDIANITLHTDKDQRK